MHDGLDELLKEAERMAARQVKALRDAYRQRRRQAISRLAMSPGTPDRLRSRLRRAAGVADSTEAEDS